MWLGLAWATAAAQGLGGGRVVTSSASLDTLMTYTDTQQRSTGDRVSDAVVQIKPGFQLSSSGGRVRGSLSYALDALYHSSSADASSLQNSLNSAFTADLISGQAAVDVTATVSQQILSPFGQQSVDITQTNPNRVEVANVSVSPYIQGRFGDVANYSVRLNAGGTNGRHSIAADSSTYGALMQLSSASTAALFGWDVQASRQHSQFRASTSTSSDQVSADLTARPDPELLLTLRGGREANDIETTDRRSYGTWGWGARWTPSDRTTASYDTSHRYFGQSHQLTLENRMPLSSFRYTSTRDASVSSNPSGVGQPITAYQLLSLQLTSAFPDPVARDQAVQDILRSLGQDPNAVVAGGFATSAVTLQRRDDLAWTYLGRRATLTLQAFSSTSSVIDANSPQAGSDPVRQTGYTATASHKLTPTASIGLTGSRLITKGTSTQTGNDLKSLSVNWTDQIGRRTSANLSARYSVFNGSADPYRESSVTASVSMRF